MKRAVTVFLIVVGLCVFSSCVPKEEIVYIPPIVISPPEPPPVIVEPAPVPAIPQPVIRYEKQLRCEDDTRVIFNSCGLDILPFLRPVFADIDKDGTRELIAGSKDGTLRLYKKEGNDEWPGWRLVGHYFDGIKAGAFSAPAVGDIDNDGMPEVLVGTGGFSSESGRVLIYRNAGTSSGPVWKIIEDLNISVGNDATPVLFDIDGDGRPDLIVGNSTGGLVLYRNNSDPGGVVFRKDNGYFNGIKAGMYAAPAIASSGNKIVMVVGDNMGRLSLFEKSGKGNSHWSRSRLNINVPNFSAPTFTAGLDPGRTDLVVSDGDGQMYYFRNRKGDFRQWEELPDYFSGRLLAGPACTPSVSDNNGRRSMVTGNIGGGIKLFEYVQGAGKIPWKEKKNFFDGIRLSSFSRGVMTEWEGRDLLITGQQDGLLRAFINHGSRDNTAWTEMKGFFQGTGRIMHAAPAVYDLDGDGRWELIVGDAEGRVRAFRQRRDDGAKFPLWEEIVEPFRHINVDRYASPSVFSESGLLYIIVGQQDGRIVEFSSGTGHEQPVFKRNDFLSDIRVDNHSSPSVIYRDGLVDLSIGDYNGSLRHFTCRSVDVEIGQDRVEKN